MILSKTAAEAQEPFRAKDGTVVQSDRTLLTNPGPGNEKINRSVLIKGSPVGK
jgi:hypothetical protein